MVIVPYVCIDRNCCVPRIDSDESVLFSLKLSRINLRSNCECCVSLAMQVFSRSSARAFNLEGTLRLWERAASPMLCHSSFRYSAYTAVPRSEVESGKRSPSKDLAVKIWFVSFAVSHAHWLRKHRWASKRSQRQTNRILPVCSYIMWLQYNNVYARDTVSSDFLFLQELSAPGGQSMSREWSRFTAVLECTI